MALVDWTDEQKKNFLCMQFNAQHHYYHEQFSRARFDIIEQGNTAIGRLYVDRRVDEIRIIDIALLPAHRGQGIGGNIMQSLIDEAACDDKSLSIHVEHNNPAMHLYQRLGFRHVSDEGVYYFMKWEATDNSAATNQKSTD